MSESFHALEMIDELYPMSILTQGTCINASSNFEQTEHSTPTYLWPMPNHLLLAVSIMTRYYLWPNHRFDVLDLFELFSHHIRFISLKSSYMLTICIVWLILICNFYALLTREAGSVDFASLEGINCKRESDTQLIMNSELLRLGCFVTYIQGYTLPDASRPRTVRPGGRRPLFRRGSRTVHWRRPAW